MNEVEKVIAQIASTSDEIEECQKIMRSDRSAGNTYKNASIRRASLMLKLVTLAKELKSAWEKQYE